MRQVFDLVREPRGKRLRRLIHALAQHGSTVLMVVQDDLGLSDPAEALLTRLRPYLQEETRGSSWPGTTLLYGHAATIRRFRLTRGVVAAVVAAADGLYAWQQPTLPEDLAFLREDGTPILTSVCHEHLAHLEVTDEEWESLSIAAPGIRSIVRPRGQGA